MLIHACLHLDKHFVTTHVQFTSFNDIVNLLRGIDNGQQTTDDGKRRDVMPHVWNNEQENITDNIETQNIASLQDFWSHFESKCIKYNFADTVFRYLVMVRYYYGAPLPDYLYEKYDPRPLKGSQNEDYVRFENFLAGTSNEFIGRGAPTSGTATHLLHLKALKNPVDFMRYVKGVVFPGKQFMIEKYDPQPLKGGKNKKGKGSPLGVRGRFWWLWYGYRWYCGLRGLFKMISGK